MAKRPQYASKAGPGGMIAERVMTTPRRKNLGGGYTETGMSAKSPYSAGAVKKKIENPPKKKTSAKLDPRGPRYA